MTDHPGELPGEEERTVRGRTQTIDWLNARIDELEDELASHRAGWPQLGDRPGHVTTDEDTGRPDLAVALRMLNQLGPNAMSCTSAPDKPKEVAFYFDRLESAHAFMDAMVIIGEVARLGYAPAPAERPAESLSSGWSAEMEGSVVTRGDIELTLRDANTLRIATTPDDDSGLCCMVDVPFSCIEALTGRRLAAAERPATDVLARIGKWTHEYGAALCPTAGSADTFGDGMREAKRQVATMLAAAERPQEQECTGATAFWCPRCGDCKCPRDVDGECEFDTDDCPLHGPASQHAAAERPQDAPRSEPATGGDPAADFVRTRGEACNIKGCPLPRRHGGYCCHSISCWDERTAMIAKLRSVANGEPAAGGDEDGHIEAEVLAVEFEGMADVEVKEECYRLRRENENLRRAWQGCHDASAEIEDGLRRQLSGGEPAAGERGEAERPTFAAKRLAALRAEKKRRLQREEGIEHCEACGVMLKTLGLVPGKDYFADEECIYLCLACGTEMSSDEAALQPKGSDSDGG